MKIKGPALHFWMQSPGKLCGICADSLFFSPTKMTAVVTSGAKYHTHTVLTTCPDKGAQQYEQLIVGATVALRLKMDIRALA